jgi:23S rRNA pseudouridine1911/1915/1917 synthase
VLSTRGRYSLVEVTLETGRKHQIRVHLAGLGCPVAGDAVYGATTDPAGRLALHATRLAFDHPVTGKRVGLESPLPAELRRVTAG